MFTRHRLKPRQVFSRRTWCVRGYLALFLTYMLYLLCNVSALNITIRCWAALNIFVWCWALFIIASLFCMKLLFCTHCRCCVFVCVLFAVVLCVNCRCVTNAFRHVDNLTAVGSANSILCRMWSGRDMGNVGSANTALYSRLSSLMVCSARDCSVVLSDVPYSPCACRWM